jgi:hypothetical protein
MNGVARTACRSGSVRDRRRRSCTAHPVREETWQSGRMRSPAKGVGGKNRLGGSNPLVSASTEGPLTRQIDWSAALSPFSGVPDLLVVGVLPAVRCLRGRCPRDLRMLPATASHRRSPLRVSRRLRPSSIRPGSSGRCSRRARSTVSTSAASRRREVHPSRPERAAGPGAWSRNGCVRTHRPCSCPRCRRWREGLADRSCDRCIRPERARTPHCPPTTVLRSPAVAPWCCHSRTIAVLRGVGRRGLRSCSPALRCASEAAPRIAWMWNVARVERAGVAPRRSLCAGGASRR